MRKTVAAVVAAGSLPRIPRSAWQNRMNARSRAGALLSYPGLATIFRGIQSASRISTATGLHRSGSPGP